MTLSTDKKRKAGEQIDRVYERKPYRIWKLKLQAPKILGFEER